MSESTGDSLSTRDTPNTPSPVSLASLSDAPRPSDVNPKRFDKKDDWDYRLLGYKGPDVHAVKGSAGYFIINGKLITPDTIFTTKEEIEGKKRIVPLKYLWAVYGLICPGNTAKGEPRHGLSLKWFHGNELPATDIHHLVKYRDARGRVRKLHMAKYLRLVCHDHNAEYQEPFVYPFEVIKSLGGVPLVAQGSTHPLEREKMPAAHASSQEPHGNWSSEEGARSDKMTWRYQQHVFNPFGCQFCKSRHVGLLALMGAQKKLKDLANDLEEDLNVGKAQTYEKYLRKDAGVGYFGLYTEDGEDWLERTGKKYPRERLGLPPETESENDALAAQKEAQP